MQDATNSVFERIALAISGGGFRAAAYGLGTLNALHLLGVLENVHMLSTISGGTISGAFYALRRKQGDSFDTIYTDLYNILANDEILGESISQWKEAAQANNQNYKLIRAFSNVYNRDLYDGALFDVFWQADPPERPFHLQSVMFSATELHTGIAFRFQYASHLPPQIRNDSRVFDSFYIGNGNVTIPRNRAREIRLADIVAASSCFPVGFEPLVLPNDFFPSSANDLVFRTTGGTQVPIDRLGLIDGGVYDNQGIEAIVRANQRNADYIESLDPKPATKTNAAVDEEEDKVSSSGSIDTTLKPEWHQSLDPSTMVLIADVASAEKGIYEPPGDGPAGGKNKPIGSIGQILKTTLMILLVVAGVLTVAQLGSFYRGNFFFGFLTGLALAIAAMLFVVLKLWTFLTDQLEELSSKIYHMAMPVFLQFSFRQWGYLLKVRLMTMVKLLLSVFLRRVRSLNYGLVFQNDQSFAPKAVISSILSSIVRDADRPVTPEMSQVRRESRLFSSIIKEGSEMGTTLWWLDDKPRMDYIIAGAEITLIYRILLYLEKSRKNASKPLPPLDQQVLDRASLMWQAFVLAQDDNQSDTYFRKFRLHSSMMTAVATPGTKPAELIDLARFNLPRTV